MMRHQLLLFDFRHKDVPDALSHREDDLVYTRTDRIDSSGESCTGIQSPYMRQEEEALLCSARSKGGPHLSQKIF